MAEFRQFLFLVNLLKEVLSDAFHARHAWTKEKESFEMGSW